MKPGLQRAIPATILAFGVAAFIVSVMRWLYVFFLPEAVQAADRMKYVAENYTYDPQVTLVLAPFLMVFAFIWGMGGLDARMSEHAHGPQESPLEGVAIVPVAESHDDHHDPYEEEARRNPLSLLSGQIWTIGTVVLLVVLGLMAFAQLPHGLRLITTGNPEADVASNALNTRFDLPVGLGTFNADKLAVFLGFIAFTMISLLVVAGLLGLLFYSLNQGVTSVKAVRSTSIDDPENHETFTGRAAHAPLRAGRGALNVVGRGAGALARGLKRGLPRFFGQR